MASMQIVLWREGLPAYPPPPFMWEDKNYLLKMTSDLDFLAEAQTLIEALGVPREKVSVPHAQTPCVGVRPTNVWL